MVSFLKRYKYHQIGTPPPSGQSRHHRLPLVLPYPTSSLRGFSISTLNHSNSFYTFILIRLPTYFPISVLARLGVALEDSADPPGELLRPLTRSCFLLLLLGRLFLYALPFFLGIFPPSLWSPPFPLHALALISFCLA